MEALVRAAKAGDEAALYALLKGVERRLYSRAFYLLGDADEALDATQDALLKIYTHLGEFRFEATFETWASRIVTNVCLDRLRRRVQTVAVDGIAGIVPGGDDVETRILTQELADALVRAVTALPDRYRVPLLLRYLDNMPYEAIAERLGLPLGTVKSHVHRARSMLKEALKPLMTGG